MAFPDFKAAQPEAIRRLNQKYAKNKQSKNSLRNAVDLLVGFSEKTTIHGLGRLFNRKANNFERFFWLLTFSLALFGTIYVCIFLSDRFQAGTLQSIVADTGAPVYKISFPAVTICNVNRLNWQRLQQAKEHFLPGESNNETLHVFEKVIGLFDRIEFARFEIFEALENQPIHLVENVNFSLVFEFMTWRCDELLAHCQWRHRTMNCCEIFLKRRSKTGICWTFNTLETPEGRQRQKLDSKYPWRTGSGGPGSALSARVWINKEKHFSSDVEKGITVMIAEPNVWHRDPYFIPENTDTTVAIDPTIYFHDNDTRSLSATQRQCVFDDEHKNHNFKVLKGFVYMQENCEAECHQEYLVEYCNCSMDLLFPPDHFLYTYQHGSEKYVHNTIKGMVCKCFNNCYSLQYMTYVRPTFLPPDVRGNKSYVDLDIHFRSETMMVYCTNLVFSWIDLMVAFGGIAGLFMGCSLISAVEVIYLAFVQLPSFFYSTYKRNPTKPEHQQYQQNIQQLNNQFNASDMNYYQYKRNSKNRISIVENIKRKEFYQ